MAKIVQNEHAPAEAVHYSLAGVDFDLGGSGKKSFETEDRAVLANAEAHPWLSVEYKQPDVVGGEYVQLLKPEDDHLSAAGSPFSPNDPEAVAQAEADKVAADDNPVAIDGGKDQTEAVKTGDVAETLAADPTSKTSDKKKDS